LLSVVCDREDEIFDNRIGVMTGNNKLQAPVRGYQYGPAAQDEKNSK